MRGWAASASACSSSGAASADLGGAAERVVGCRQAFHEAGAAGEELQRARRRSAAAVARARVGRDEKRDMVVRVGVQFDLELDATEERRRRMEDEAVRPCGELIVDRDPAVLVRLPAATRSSPR